MNQPLPSHILVFEYPHGKTDRVTLCGITVRPDQGVTRGATPTCADCQRLDATADQDLAALMAEDEL